MPPTDASKRERIVIVSPCRDEAATVERTLASIEGQTRPPDLWVIVDDGSTDATPQVLARAAARIPWLRVVTRPDRGRRRVGSGVIEAFYAGLEVVEGTYDFLAKMDMDLELSPTYIERILGRFAADARLAAASGTVWHRTRHGLEREFSMAPESVAGCFKFYRREAFERIGGFVRAVMWDGIDFHRARMIGYRTQCYSDDDLRIVHLRLMGSSDRGVLRGRMRWGAGQWFMGTSLPYIVASGLLRMREPPRVIGGAMIVVGYLAAALRGAPRYGDASFRRSLRTWQYERLGRALRGARP